VSDFNGDGISDLAVANYGTATVSIMLGNGDGTFKVASKFHAGLGLQSLAVADFNGDGKQDIVTANFAWHADRFHGAIIDESDVRVFLGNGDGTFKAAGKLVAGLGPASVAVGDFNGDGIPDLVVVNRGLPDRLENTVSVLLGNGDGTFQSAQNFAVGSYPQSVAVGDFNGDGHLDLTVANANDGTVSILLGNGDGTFQAAQNYAVGSNPLSVAIGDFNGDGFADLAIANQGTYRNNYTGSSVSILLGNGDGTFQAPQSYAIGCAPSLVAVGDVNNDGHLDVVVANSNIYTYLDGKVSVLLGNGDGTFLAPQSYAVGSGTSSLAGGDFNRDGFPDLAVTSSWSSTLTILINTGDWGGGH
jgi:hypothetical protein